MIGTPIDVASRLFLLMMTTIEQYDTNLVSPYPAILLTQGRQKLTMQAEKENTAGYTT